jgi:hypothetical protein
MKNIWINVHGNYIVQEIRTTTASTLTYIEHFVSQLTTFLLLFLCKETPNVHNNVCSMFDTVSTHYVFASNFKVSPFSHVYVELLLTPVLEGLSLILFTPVLTG